MNRKYNIIDLFAGCGGLLEGFMQTGKINPIASVEWEKPPVDTLRNRLKNKWSIGDAEESVLYFDMQRVDELCNGYEDPKYGKSVGLKKIVGDRDLDIIIGGPPCQSYSVAGRIRDSNNMKSDYRNYLFEHYMEIVEKFQPKYFIFENVPGMLSAMPDGTPIINLIKRDIEGKNYQIIDNIRENALIDISEYGVSQNRSRVILLGINKNKVRNSNIEHMLYDFYNEILPKHKEIKTTLYDAIGDLPSCYPLDEPIKLNRRNVSHTIPNINTPTWHIPRYHNKRDIEIFRILAKDIYDEKYEYTDPRKLNELYFKATGSKTNVHKYHVLRKDEPSTTILAHLYKDGLRFIHYDYEQARSLTVREAARIQSFPDDFEFIGAMGNAYKMIGNAVPPKFAKKLAQSLIELDRKYSNI